MAGMGIMPKIVYFGKLLLNTDSKIKQNKINISTPSHHSGRLVVFYRKNIIDIQRYN